MAGLHISLTDGNLSIDDTPMRTHAWYVLDLRPLWMPSAIRGSDKVLPGATGVRAYPRRKTITEVTLSLIITGEADRNGIPPAIGVPGATVAYFAQLEANIAYLRANVIDPNFDNARGTRAITLTMPSGGTRTGDVHIVGMTATSSVLHTMSCDLTISIPGGTLN